MRRCVALSGGVGGAKLALGLMRVVPDDSLTVIVNTGDDFAHFGLHISPDVDTTLYTLSGLSNLATGWGRRNETWTFMQTMASLGGETWFRLGDGDLALHAERTRRLIAGETLAQITADIARRLGISAMVLPMSDDTVRTRIGTAAGELDFQDYFVRQQCRPAVTSLRYEGAAQASVAPRAAELLRDGMLDCIVICPSNPYLSIAPILAIPGMRELLRSASVPIVAISPLVGARAVKGPIDKIMRELGLPVTPAEVVRFYDGLIDGFVLDVRDQAAVAEIDLPVLAIDTLMQTLEDRERVARETLAFAASLSRSRRAVP